VAREWARGSGVGAAWREGRVDRAGKLVEGTKKVEAALEWMPCGWWVWRCGGVDVVAGSFSFLGWVAPSWALVARRRDHDVNARKREQAHHNRVEGRR
jgi:hypothetical protein